MNTRHSCPCCLSNNVGYAFISKDKMGTYIMIKCANCGCCTFPMKTADDAEKLWKKMNSKCFAVQQTATI